MQPYYEADGITIYHGDCREIREWLKADVLITDPPYGMAYVSSMTAERRPVLGDEDTRARDEVLRDWGSRPAAVFGTWRVQRPPGTRQIVTWYKSGSGLGMGDLSMPWGCVTEEIYILGHGWTGARRPNVIITTGQRGGAHGPSARLGHPTPKPVGLMSQLVEAAPPGLIADPFMGVGATLLAARDLGHRASGIELEERYCEIAARRLDQGVLNFGAA